MSGEGRPPSATAGELCAEFGDVLDELAEPDFPGATALVARGLILRVARSGWSAGRSTNERPAREEG